MQSGVSAWGGSGGSVAARQPSFKPFTGVC